MNEELKPCPFCGGEVEIEQTGKNELRVRCKECHMGLKQKVLRKSSEWLEETLRNSWNTRPAPSVESVEEDLFTVNDIVSVKTALLKYGYGDMPDSNDLSNVQIAGMFKKLAELVRRGLYMFPASPDHTKTEE